MVANLNNKRQEQTPERETSLDILKKTGVMQFVYERTCGRSLNSFMKTLNEIENELYLGKNRSKNQKIVLDYIGEIARDKTKAMIREIDQDKTTAMTKDTIGEWQNVHPITAYQLLTKYFSEPKTK